MHQNAHHQIHNACLAFVANSIFVKQLGGSEDVFSVLPGSSLSSSSLVLAQCLSLTPAPFLVTEPGYFRRPVGIWKAGNSLKEEDGTA